MINLVIVKFGISFYIYLLLFLVMTVCTYFIKRGQKREIAESKSQMKKLRKIWKRVPVEYDELEIKTNCWKQEIEVGSGTRSHNEYVDVSQNVILLSKTYGVHKFDLEVRVAMEPEILQMKIAYKKELSLYYNPNNPDENFLDLEFLLE